MPESTCRGNTSILVRVDKDDFVTKIYLNRPEALNAFNLGSLWALERAVREFEKDSGSRVAILTGAGEKAFCTGADIKDIKKMSPHEMVDWCLLGNRVFNQIAQSLKPVIAAVNGYALGGGCELALACDFRIAAEEALFGFPESSLGWIPGWGGSKRLAQLIGVTKAKEMLMIGTKIRAEEAQKIGLVNKCVPRSSLAEEALEYARILADRNPLSLAAIKSMLMQQGGRVEEEAHILEALTVGSLTRSEFAARKIKDFEEKIHKKK